MNSHSSTETSNSPHKETKTNDFDTVIRGISSSDSDTTSISGGGFRCTYSTLLNRTTKHPYNGAYQRLTTETVPDSQCNSQPIGDPNRGSCCIAAVCSATVTAVFKCPFDVVKCQLQTQRLSKDTAFMQLRSSQFMSVLEKKRASDRIRYSWSVTSFKSAFDCAMKVFRLAPFRGVAATAMRNVLGWSASACVFEESKRMIASFKKGSSKGDKADTLDAAHNSSCNSSTSDPLSPFELLIAGGCGGLAFWLLPPVYALDVVKSNLQADSLPPQRRQFASTRECIRTLYYRGGPARFFRGWSPAVLRACPSNALQLCLYSLVVQTLSSK
eukprot:Filipodium_phascolosomae@DN1502_c0_g1_i1.p1